MAMIAGSLVEITGLKEIAKVADGVESEVTSADLGGVKAQLLDFDRQSNKWLATTFTGQNIAISEEFLRPLKDEDLKDYDFVFGPRSDPDILGYDLSACISAKGYAVVKVLMSEGDTKGMMAAATKLDEDMKFSRLAPEFERGYLGVEGTGKVVHVDPQDEGTPSYVKDSPLWAVDQNFNAITGIISPYTTTQLGFDVYSRSATLLHLPLASGDEDKYTPADIEDGEAESYMHMMCRKSLTLIQFAGPGTGTMKLIPYAPSNAVGEAFPEIKLTTDAHTVVLFLNNRYEHSCESQGKTLSLSTFLLRPSVQFTLSENVTGDTDTLGVLGTGPPPPPGQQVTAAGMHCRFGCSGDGIYKYWVGACKAGGDGFGDIPITRWDHAPYYDPDHTQGGSYTRHAVFGIEGIDLFDNRFFEIANAEAKGMDPGQRHVMEVTYTALHDGGYDKRGLARQSENIGMFVGMDHMDWLNMSAGNIIAVSGVAPAVNAIVSNRFSYNLNLKGASMTIDTACSASLVCVNVAKLHLRYKDFDPMPCACVNGVNVILYPLPFVGCCSSQMLSHEGRCFTFNATADGYARGEACGSIAFKYEQWAPDKAIACLAGSQANQDGRSASLTAPNGPAQERCISSVLREIRLTPTEIDCFECHGTGTALGDPIEVGAFKKVMSVTPRDQPIEITSSKSSIGHGEGSAGMAGFTKCCLQVAHCEAASNLHLRVKNPHLDLDGFPCQVLSELTTMAEDSAYSAVSSFGFGGTNAHAEAWGKNIMTSRGSHMMDVKAVFQKKLRKAPHAEITITGDDVRDWETTGLPADADPTARYTIELDEDGMATWEKVDEEFLEFGNEFFIKGSFSKWKTEPLDSSSDIPGLWEGTIELGASGEETFQIIADEDENMVYSPATTRCSLKASQINGPAAADKSFSWLITGSPGDVYKIEFFVNEKTRSVLWFKET